MTSLFRVIHPRLHITPREEPRPVPIPRDEGGEWSQPARYRDAFKILLRNDPLHQILPIMRGEGPSPIVKDQAKAASGLTGSGDFP